MPPKKNQRSRPAVFVWDGDHMIPLPRFKLLCDRQFVVHEEYVLEPVVNRSMASHNHYFAALGDAWDNLAEEFDGKFPTPEHLRAHALVKTGWCTETDTVCDTPKEAKSLAALIRRLSPYAVIQISGNVVKVFEPVSQQMHGPNAMRKEAFEDSKNDVLNYVAGMTHSTPRELKKNAGRSA
jgi:hypothetical protein